MQFGECAESWSAATFSSSRFLPPLVLCPQAGTVEVDTVSIRRPANYSCGGLWVEGRYRSRNFLHRPHFRHRVIRFLGQFNSLSVAPSRSPSIVSTFARSV